jgi:hypothetical protein
MTPPSYSCAVCATVLEYHRSTDGLEHWVHTGANIAKAGVDDHVVVPVLTSEVRVNALCDFCMADDPAWRLPVAEHTWLTVVEPDDYATHYQDSGGWAACDLCAEQIRLKDWNKLSFRMMRGRQSYSEEKLAKELFDLVLATVRPHITGPLERIDNQ